MTNNIFRVWIIAKDECCVYTDIILLGFLAKSPKIRCSRNLGVTCHRIEIFGTYQFDVKCVPVGEEFSNRPLEESTAAVAGEYPIMFATAHVITD